MDRRKFMAIAGAMALETGLNLGRPRSLMSAPPAADITLRIGPAWVELAPGRSIQTVGYNAASPGPILRMQEGKQISVNIFNDSNVPEIVHWHGQLIPSAVDGTVEEGTPVVPAHGHRTYTFTPRPSGTRWYHTHAFAGRNLQHGTYTGQFGFVYVEPKNDPGRYDEEVFLALREWEPFFTQKEEKDEESRRRSRGIEPASFQGAEETESKADGLEVGYRYFSINNRSLPHGEPIRVRQGMRVLFHLLNASATEIRRLAFPGHQFTVVTMDGNPVPTRASVEILQLGPGERIDAIVEMNQPGVWILGATNDKDREAGMGVIVEYAGKTSRPRWIFPPLTPWDYTVFGARHGKAAPVPQPDHQFDLVFRKIPGGKGGFNRWTINGKSFPRTEPLVVHSGGRYRLAFRNDSDDAHPVHLHRHIFELTNIAGRKTSGIRKDTVVVLPNSHVEVDFVADNPGLTLFHCHQQLHMDFGFMELLKYA